MKGFIVIILLFIFSNMVFSLNKSIDTEDKTFFNENLERYLPETGIKKDNAQDDKKDSIIVDTDSNPYTTVEVMPMYPGGTSKMHTFILKNLSYPKESLEKKVEGIVFIQFVVGKDGSLSNVKVVRKLDDACDREAIRLIKSMPTWNPGKQKGKVVPVYVVIPIFFKIGEKTYNQQ